MNAMTLRSRIHQELKEHDEIVSIFEFSINHGYYCYAYVLGVFRQMEHEGLVKMTKLSRPGMPWRVTPGRNFQCKTQ